MATFNTYQQIGAETSLARKWFFRALIASLVIHGGLIVFFRATKLERFTPYTERLVPREFTSLGRVDVDAKLLDPEPEKQEEPKKSTQEAPNIQLPSDTPTTDAVPSEIVYKPTAPEMVQPIANEKPKVESTNLQTLAKMEQNSSRKIDKDLNAMQEQLLKDKPRVSSTSMLKLSDSTKSGVTGGQNTGHNSAIPGTKSLDDALAGTGGGLKNGDRIGIRGGALFEYDKADLRPDAMEDLKKIGMIVKRYPGAIFSIEGYADSFGSQDYNLALSQRRAEAVKAWLLVNIGVNPFKIEAIGHGSTNFVVSPAGTVEQQEKNRRVEIGIKFPR